MSLTIVCRLCLAMNTTMRTLTDSPLQDVYEKLTNISLTTPHRPLVACLICYSQLRKCHKLMVRSVRADKVLSQVWLSGELSDDSIATINSKANQLNSSLSVTPIKLIAITNAKVDLMKLAVKKEPIQMQHTEEFDVNEVIHVDNLKTDQIEESYYNRTGLPNVEDRESGVFIYEQYVKNEELEGAVDIDNEGWTRERDIETAVQEDVIVKREEFIYGEDKKHHELEGAKSFKLVDKIYKDLEPVEDVQGNEYEDAVPGIKSKQTHTNNIQVRTLEERNIPDKWRQCKKIKEIESPNINASTYMSGDIKQAAVMQISENTLKKIHSATNGDKILDRDEGYTRIDTDDGDNSSELSDKFICDNCGDMFDDKSLLIAHIVHHITANGKKQKSNKETQHKSTRLLKDSLSKTRVVNNHTELQAGNYRFECDICHRSFARRSNFVVHIKTHTGEKSFQCTMCRRWFSRKEHLNKHLRVHSGEKPFECAICQRKFSRKEHRNNHLKVHSGDKPFECEICLRRFTERGNLKNHLRVHTRKKSDKTFECKICQRKFYEKYHLNSHFRTHSGVKLFECEICQKSFAQQSNLNVHLKVHTGEKRFECAICQQRYTEKASLVQHIRSHTGEKPFECSVCHRRFGRKDLLYVHFRTHTKEKPYECAVCETRFSLKGNLYNHMKIHTGVKRFECEICKQRFTESGSLKRHLKWHTGEKPFKCTLCPRMFYVIADLNIHLRVHNRENLFECDICQRKYIHKHSLKRHLITHTIKKPFKCAICEKRFLEKSALNRHLRTHLRDKTF